VAGADASWQIQGCARASGTVRRVSGFLFNILHRGGKREVLQVPLHIRHAPSRTSLKAPRLGKTSRMLQANKNFQGTCT
jgi:hypothetical protein